MKIKQCELYRYVLPLRCPLAVGSETLSERRGFLLHLRSEGGVSAWGEAAPLPGLSGEGEAEVLRCFGEAVRKILTRRFTSPRDCEGLRLVPSLQFGFSQALCTLFARAEGRTLSSYLWRQAAAQIPVNALIAGETSLCVKQAEHVRSAGYRWAKLKVGVAVEEARVRLRKVAQALGPSVRLRLDGNRFFSLDDARALAAEGRRYGVQYFEEPTGEIEGLLLLLREGRFPLPVAFDETLRLKGPCFLSTLERGSWIVLKPTVTGFLASYDLAREAMSRSVGVVISSSFESSVGLSGLAALASGLNRGNPSAAGLGTAPFFSKDVTSDPLLPRRGLLVVREPQVDVTRLVRVCHG